MSNYNFSDRHIGPKKNHVSEMLKVVNASSIESLIEETVPNKIHMKKEMNLPNALSESRFIEHMKGLAQKNKIIDLILGLAILILFCQE